MPQPIHGLLLAVTVGLLTACGSEDRQAPTTADLVIEKAPAQSGDAQVGVAGEPLPQDLRARVTRDGKPVEGLTVYWTTMQGTMNPPSDLTDAEGISASRWTTSTRTSRRRLSPAWSRFVVPGPRARSFRG